MNGLRAWYVRCTLDGCRSGGGRRHVSDVPKNEPATAGESGRELAVSQEDSKRVD